MAILSRQMEVMLFGQLKEILSCEVITVGDISNTDQLANFLHDKYPILAETSYRIAIDKRLIAENTEIFSTSQIALLPPFSGG